MESSRAATRADAYPLAFNQERIWFLQNLEAESLNFGYVAKVRLNGALDTGRLRSSLKSLIDRHGVLRAVFPEQDGYPLSQTTDLDMDTVLSIVESAESNY